MYFNSNVFFLLQNPLNRNTDVYCLPLDQSTNILELIKYLWIMKRLNIY